MKINLNPIPFIVASAKKIYSFIQNLVNSIFHKSVNKNVNRSDLPPVGQNHKVFTYNELEKAEKAAEKKKI